ncbi:DUF411 domain-containing protein [Psychromonas antarctica]|uniref:DUF411 domain-containing protein n=1 Tax=Psychromonas antarctica TaxID=67573 RepID=UPI001EE786BE|nr:DUF411 domain-containing protein [Psychromonas antarctica]MCG6201693.1 CopG family transcriptional regulator [Psychromonas antarctica]
MKLTKKTLVFSLTMASFSVFAQPSIELYKSPTCGCCTKWAAVMEDKGYTVNIHHQNDWSEIKKEFAMPQQLQSCHSAVIDGYLIEGHVPESDMARLLKERPDNISAIAVPGMPKHSPGMAKPGDAYRHFKVISVSEEGLALYNEY